MNILIEDEFNWLEKANISSKLINDVIKESLIEEGFSKEAEVSVILTNNKMIKELNKQHRHIDEETDVLSFPQIDWESDENDINYENDAIDYVLLGDIIISTQKLEEQAKDYGHSNKRELGFLLVHSMLHLLGYDHMSEEDEEAMIKKQKDVLEKLGLAR